MNMDKFLSIVIPMYNAAETIELTLDSLRKQTNKCFEVIIVNDGSKDGCELIVEQYKRKYSFELPTIKLITTNNSGVSHARNIGIMESKGTNILFLDADDRLSEFSVDIIYDNLKDNVFFLWTRDYCELYDGTSPVKKEKKFIFEVAQLFAYKRFKTSFFNYVYNKSILVKYDILFDENLRYGEDNLFFWTYISVCMEQNINKFCFVNENLYYYYDNQQSCMKRMSSRQQDAILAIYNAKSRFESSYDILQLINDYLIPRTIFSVLKNYSLGGEYELFISCANSYDARKNAIKLVKYGEIKWKILAGCYILNKLLFYYILMFLNRGNKIRSL